MLNAHVRLDKMTKRKKEKREPSKVAGTKERVVMGKDFSVAREVEYIVRKARDHDSRLVILGPLALFSTVTGDAWMLDLDDALALCLAEDGEALPGQISETEIDFGIQWEARYVIEEDMFIAVDGAGSAKAFTGYPVSDILRAEWRTRQIQRTR
jgi:hypothetical protein